MMYDNLLGHTYEIGVRDCYSLIKDFYKQNYDIELRNYARPDNWWKADLNLYYTNFSKEGFEVTDDPITDLQIGDLILMAFDCGFPNHCAVYVGGGKIIHHPYNQLSREEFLRGAYRNNMTAVIRRKNLPVLVKPEEVFDLSQHLSQHWKDKLDEKETEN